MVASRHSLLARPRGHLDLGDFARGFLYPLRGLAIMRRHPGLMRFWLPPIVLTCAALIASLVFALRYHEVAANLVWRAPVGAGFVVSALHWLWSEFALIVGLGLGMLMSVMLANLFAAPFNDALSEAVEELETGQPTRASSLAQLLRDLSRTLRLELTKLLIYVLVMGPLWFLSWLVPGLGQVLYMLFASLFTALYFAVDYIDWPASRRGLSLRARLELLRARPLMTLGFGAAVALCLFVPLLNLCFMPLAVAGGTRLFLDLEAYAARAL
ncbi:MAG: cysZ [Myxococcaceae bacterium]|nr:cysZ [Myxococcaceae bacterium]